MFRTRKCPNCGRSLPPWCYEEFVKLVAKKCPYCGKELKK